MSPEIIADKPENLPALFARRCEQEARRVVSARGRFALALPGGSAATALLPALAAARVDFTRTEFFWGDERAVAADDPESNFGLARRLLLEPAGVPQERLHRMPADGPDAEQAAEAYAAELERVLGRPARLDLVLLGVGPDGHVASLFPGHAALRESARLVVAVHDSPKPPARRLTLTLPVLAGAALVVVAAWGGAKATMLREALEHEGSTLPVALVARRASRALFLLDPAAAGRLRARRP